MLKSRAPGRLGDQNVAGLGKARREVAKPGAGDLIRISITAADFDASAATMPPGFAGFIC